MKTRLPPLRRKSKTIEQNVNLLIQGIRDGYFRIGDIHLYPSQEKYHDIFVRHGVRVHVLR